MTNTAWEEEEDKLWLLTPEEVEVIPDGIELEAISGDKELVGSYEFDMDTRFGFTAWGIRESNCPSTWVSSGTSLSEV